MSLTDKQKKTVAEWMGWQRERGSDTTFCRPTFEDGVGVAVNFSLNDAALCVEKIQKREEWLRFIFFAAGLHRKNHIGQNFTAWLMTMESDEAVNFFTAMAAWIEEEKGI